MLRKYGTAFAAKNAEEKCLFFGFGHQVITYGHSFTVLLHHTSTTFNSFLYFRL